MIELFNKVSFELSRCVTRKYSTSFSLGIYMLHKSLHSAIYSIYGFVRIADEIVDSFEGYDKENLLRRFKEETYAAIREGISTNPILHAFQITVRKYQIDLELIETFLTSMEMDLSKKSYDTAEFQKYILGSAEVVGLMCLKVFVDGDEGNYARLKLPAMHLGSAFQKVNFLRDLKADFSLLGRSYFPQVDLDALTAEDKANIENSILKDFQEAFQGIKDLPSQAKLGVYTAYVYYYQLFLKIKHTSPSRVMKERIRISNRRKMFLLLRSYVQYNLKMI